MAEVKSNILDLNSAIDLLNKSAQKQIETFERATITFSNYNKAIPKSPSDYVNSLKIVNTSINEVDKSTKRLQQTSKQMEQASIRESNARNSLNKQREREIARNKELERAYIQLNAQHVEASKRLQDLVARGKLATQTQKQYNAELNKAQTEFNKLNGRIIQADTAVRRFNRNVGNYPQLNQIAGSLRNLMGAFGLFGGVYLFASAVKNAFTTIRDFDKANRDLSATMGKSREQITALTNNAKQLGATTRYTAVQITGLQKELAKLGFSQTEILNSTKAISSLASAVDTDLTNAAMVAGSTLRSFNLDSSEMSRVVDVMAKSFTSSALDIENFKESIKYVGPIASAGNISLEQTTALLGILADNGIKGSQAGTSLRRIMTDLIRTGKPFNEAFADVAKNGISVKDAFDEVGRTAQTSLVVLGKNTEKIKELNIALIDAGGSAKKMADEQLKSLSGQIDLMTSAWDGFIMSLDEGGNKLSSFLVKIINQITQTITLWQRLLSSSETLKKNDEDFVLTGSQNLAKKNLDAISNIEAKENFAREQIISLEKQKAEINKSIIDLKNKNLEIVKTDIRNTPLGNILPTQSKNEIKNNKKAIEDYNLQLIKTQGLLNGYSESLEVKTKLEDEDTEATIKNTEAKKEEQKFLIGSIGWYEKRIKQLTEEAELIKKNSKVQISQNKEYQTQLKVIEDLQKGLDKLLEIKKEELKLGKELNAEIYSQEFFNTQISNAEAKLKLINKENKAYAELTENIRIWKEMQNSMYGDSTENKPTTNIDDVLKEYNGYEDLIGRKIKGFSENLTAEQNKMFNEILSNFNKAMEDGDEQLAEYYKNQLEELRGIASEYEQLFSSFSEDFANNTGFSKIFDLFNNDLEQFKGNAKATALVISEAFQQAYNTISNASQSNFEEEYARNEQRYQNALMFANGNAESEAELLKEKERREKEIANREAKAKKKIALFNMAIDIAQAVTATIGKTGFAGIPLSYIVASLGAIQLALVASQEVPQYWKGTDNHKGGDMIINDAKGSKYQEIVQTPDGKQKVYKGRNVLVNAPKGTKVFTAEKSESILNNLMSSISLNFGEKSNNFDTLSIENKLDKLTNIIANKSEFSIVRDEAGERIFEKRNNQKMELKNNRIYLKQRNVRA